MKRARCFFLTLQSINFLFVLFLVLSSAAADARHKHTPLQDDSFQVALNLPKDFGRKHFIVGYTSTNDEVLETKLTSSSSCQDSFNLLCDGRVKQVFFSPDDSVQKVLLHLIEQEHESIKLTAFTFTDGDIAQALIEAQARGVSIELVVDPGCIRDKFSKVSLLGQNGFTIFVYDPSYKKEKRSGFSNNIMHNKFVLFGKNLLDKSILWTGSFNITKSAHRYNQENVIVLDDEHCVEKYAQRFDILKARSYQLKKKKADYEASPIALSKKGTIFEDFALA